MDSQKVLAFSDNSDLIAKTRGDDALRCRAELLDKGEFFRCSRDRDHLQKHLCIDYGVHVSFDDWAAGE